MQSLPTDSASGHPGSSCLGLGGTGRLLTLQSLGSQGRLLGEVGLRPVGFGDESLGSEGASGPGQERERGLYGGDWEISFRERVSGHLW